MTQYWHYWNKLISTIQEIESIEDEKEKEKVTQEYVNGIIEDYSNDANVLIQHILELNSDIELLNVPQSLMDSLKEALFCYINGQYLSAIATAGITAELFCVHIYNLYLQQLGIDRLHTKRRLKSFRNISQFERIETLHTIVGLVDSVTMTLHEIRKKRNNSVHPSSTYNYKGDALDCLQCIIDILNLYSASQKQAVEGAKEKIDKEVKDKTKIPK